MTMLEMVELWRVKGNRGMGLLEVTGAGWGQWR